MPATVYSPQGEIDPAIMVALRLHIDWAIQSVGSTIVLPDSPLTWIRVASIQRQIANVLRLSPPDLIVLTVTDGDWITLIPWMQRLCGDRIPILIVEPDRKGEYSLHRFKRIDFSVCMEPLIKQRIRRIK